MEDEHCWLREVITGSEAFDRIWLVIGGEPGTQLS